MPVNQLHIPLPPRLMRVLAETPELQLAYLVGGGVRDALLSEPVKDFDFEVYGVPFPRLESSLGRHGRLDAVGKSFGVLKLTLDEVGVVDFSLPRRDSKVAGGHKGFSIEVLPDLSTADASARRDFTVNSMMWLPRTGQLVDHWGGQRDLESGILRHTSAAFDEDPLRVLRGMQFCGRFNLKAHETTLARCRAMTASHRELARERIREEWLKWASRSRVPSRGLEFLRESGWIAEYPEIANTIGVPQDPDWHPEGDVWIHTLHCVDALARMPEWMAESAESRAIWMLAVLLHDTGKSQCTRREPRAGVERIVSPGHETASRDLAAAFLAGMEMPGAISERVTPLVAEHMAHLEEPSPRAIRRLARRLTPATIRELGAVMTADASGRPPRPGGRTPVVEKLLSAADALRLKEAAPKPLVLGRHLLERGWRPGPELGVVLGRAMEAQLDGEFQDLEGGIRWVMENSSKPPDLPRE